MHETQTKEKAFLVLTEYGQQRWPREEIAEEFRHLVESAGIEVVDMAVVKLREITAATYIGKGKTEELAAMVQELGVGVVIFNNNLGTAQQRNLEDAFGTKTIDRTQLILDIFALHAKTLAGKLQVELAQLQYLLPRLKGKGTMLSQLGGGIGTRGPGETKLEMDRRKIDERVTRIERELEQVKTSREVMRKKRRKQNLPLCSLVGYTSAGKTTLFNSITQSHETTDAALFTTLDTVSHTFEAQGMKVLLSDTVGFISDLPPKLIEAFKSTLEELNYADVLLHVVDASNVDIVRLYRSVKTILTELGLDEKKIIMVFNKIDKLDEDRLRALRFEWTKGVFISAQEGTGLDVLYTRIHEVLADGMRRASVKLSFTQMHLSQYLHDNCEVLDTDYLQDGAVFTVMAKPEHIAFLEKKGVSVSQLAQF